VKNTKKLNEEIAFRLIFSCSSYPASGEINILLIPVEGVFAFDSKLCIKKFQDVAIYNSSTIFIPYVALNQLSTLYELMDFFLFGYFLHLCSDETIN